MTPIPAKIQKRFCEIEAAQSASAGGIGKVPNLHLWKSSNLYPLPNSFRNRCKIHCVSPDSEVRPQSAQNERSWLPLVIATAVVLLVAGLGFLLFGRSSSALPAVSAPNAALDPYAQNLEVSGLHMSESGNLAGSKMTYVDGWITNHGPATVTGITAQVIFRSYAHDVAQNGNQAMQLIRTHDPYIDVETIAAAPLKPGARAEFRLVFDAVSPNWDGAFPEIRVLRVVSK